MGFSSPFFFIFGLAMANFFTGSLRQRTIEQKQVALMLATGFFMGVFIATYQVTADSLFLNRLGEYLDKAFLVTGILGMLSTGFFSFLQNYIRFSILTVLVVVGIIIFTLSVYVLLHVGNPEWQDPLVFAMFCSTGPIIALLLLSYWGTFGRLFNFRQSKRIIGWIDTGQLIAAILASFVIPLTAAFIPDTTDYLLVCTGSILMVGILMFLISSSFTLSKNNPREFGATVIKDSSLGKILRDPYVVMMSLLLLVSMTAFTLNQFSFQELIRVQYPNQRELTNFNAFFTGTIYTLSLIMQTFVNNRIIGTYGLRISLLLLPVILGVLSFGSVITGAMFGFDKTASPAGFIYFFLFVAASRLFNWTLRDSLENPVFKLLFIPLDGRIRFNVQAKVEGLINESSRFVAGILIFLFAFIPSFEVIHISIVLFVIAAVYFLIVNKLYSGYRKKIREKLESSELQQDRIEKGFTQITQQLEEMLTFTDSTKAVFSFKFLERLNVNQVSTWINTLIRNRDNSVRYYAQERLNELKGLSVSDRYVIRIANQSALTDRIMISRQDVIQILENGGDISLSRIERLCRSLKPIDRQYGAELILHTTHEEGLHLLVELLLDSNSRVRLTAIKSAVKRYNDEVIFALIENLANPVFSNQTLSSLILIGQPALVPLDETFYRSGQSTQLMLRIVQAMGKIGGPRAKEMLWGKIDYPNKVIVSQVLLSMGECGFKANIAQVTRIKYAIESDIADIRWNLSAIQELGTDGFKSEIINSLRWEIQNDIEHIYMLLAMLYDTRSIQLVKENIDSGTSEGITYAVELLDVFLSEQLKQRVIPALDELSDAERISRLDVFYPRTRLDSKLVLKFLINRDFTQSNRWTKACCLYEIGNQQIADFKIDLIAHMFNPDMLINEVAAWSLHQINPEDYIFHSKRLLADRKKNLDQVILDDKLSLFGKVLFFKSIEVFENVPGITLSNLAEISSDRKMTQGETLVLDDRLNNDFYIINSGKVDFYEKGARIASFKAGQFLGEHISLPQFLNTCFIVAQSDVQLISVNKDLFYELLTDDVKLAGQLIRSM
jgi:ATP:ADP antiporter, AAA family